MPILAQHRDGRWLLEAVERYLERESTGRVDPGWFHPSSLSDPCDLSLALQFLGTPNTETIPARTQRIFDMGHARDRDWKRYLLAAGLSQCLSDDDRKIVVPQWRIRGECDDVVVNPATNERFVVEIKTIKEQYWKALRGPLPQHTIQVQSYLFGHRVNNAIVLYENKNTCEVKLYIQPFSHSLWEVIISRIERILNALLSGAMPTRDFSNGCSFKGACSLYDPVAAQAKTEALLKGAIVGRCGT